MSNFHKPIIIITASSGTGKGTILGGLKSLIAFEMPISATTRQPRTGELEGKAAKPYLFLTHAEFEAKIQSDEFAEYAQYGAHYYGTLKQEVARIQASDQQVLIECEINGARNLKKIFPMSMWIFLSAPGDTNEDIIGCLRQRLESRDTETQEQIEERLKIAAVELLAREEADYVVVNHRADAATIEVANIIWQQDILSLK